MSHDEIAQFTEDWSPYRDRTIVLIDFANVEKWRDSLGWRMGVRELASLVKKLSGKVELRRFYYGSDYGQNDRSDTLTPWSKAMLETAKYNGLEIVTKRTKYLHDNVTGELKKKCDLDVEMAIDLVAFRKQYDRIVLFSGDGDMACALKFMRNNYKKQCYVFGARDHLGKETVDLQADSKVEKIMFAEDFEFKLSMERRARR